MAHFADRLIEAIEQRGNPCCIGIDPRVEMIPESLRNQVTGEAVLTCESAIELMGIFCREVLDIVAPRVPVVKVQAAYFERFGSLGYKLFEDTIAYAKSLGVLVIADVKRSDIGSTAAAYAEGLVGSASVHGIELYELGADAVTVNPYFGLDGVEPFIREAVRHDRGVFVLVRTSNPTSGQVQGLACKGVPVFMRVGALVHQWGKEHVGRRGFSAVGAVVGATQPLDAEKLRRLMPLSWFLVPGYGAQGARAADTAPAFDPRGLGAIVNSSRGIIFAHGRSPYDREFGPERWREAVAAATDAMVAEFQAMH